MCRAKRTEKRRGGFEVAVIACHAGIEEFLERFGIEKTHRGAQVKTALVAQLGKISACCVKLGTVEAATACHHRKAMDTLFAV